MTPLARIVAVTALSIAGLFFAGCVTQTSKVPQAAKVQRVEPVPEFTVIESSTNKELTPEQLATLRESVANYLRDEGYDGKQTYDVKVDFPAEKPGDKAEWVIVRIGNRPGPTYTVLAAYQGADDYYPYEYYHYGYYDPFYNGYPGWGYYDPYYPYGGYWWNASPPGHHGPGHGKPPHGGVRPGDPAVKPARWEQPPAGNSMSPGSAYPPRSANPQRWAHERAASQNGSNPTAAPSGNRGSGGGSAPPPPPRDAQPQSQPVRVQPERTARDNGNTTQEN
jgi:hypothetical protein